MAGAIATNEGNQAQASIDVVEVPYHSPVDIGCQDPDIRCQSFDPSTDIFGLNNRLCPISMRIEPPKKGKHSDIKCGHGGRSDPYADICGGLSINSPKTLRESPYINLYH